MNILLVDDNYRMGDDRTRIKFVKKLATFKDVRLGQLSLSPNLSEKTFKDLKIKPDLLFFMLYKPTIRQTWPPFLFNLGIPTVLLEEDHYETKFDSLVYSDKTVLDWYKDNKISLLLRRHSYEEKAPVESVWLPFSANEEECGSFKVTLNKIGFAGSHTSTQAYYDVRRLAIKKLQEANLLDTNYGKIYDNYFSYLGSHIGCLACSGGILHTCLAKTFEIPLTGSVLLTNKIDYSDLLFGNKKCYFEYKDDCSDIVDIAEFILQNNKEVQEVAYNGKQRVFEHHTDSKRIQELYNILKALIEKKPIPKKWGQ